jgi:hypothetical protein
MEEELRELPELPDYARRDLFRDLTSMGFTSDQCEKIIKWTETLPIHILGVENTKVSIEKGVIKVEKNEEGEIK